MKTIELDNYSDAEKIILAEQLWDSVSKEELNLSAEIKQELDKRLDNLDNNKTVLYNWEEVKKHIKRVR